jgi:hypothetical protein
MHRRALKYIGWSAATAVAPGARHQGVLARAAEVVVVVALPIYPRIVTPISTSAEQSSQLKPPGEV